MIEEMEIIPGFVVPESQLQERFSHSSGPGGQGVNTSDSRVELQFDVARSDAVPEHLRPDVADNPVESPGQWSLDGCRSG